MGELAGRFVPLDFLLDVGRVLERPHRRGDGKDGGSEDELQRRELRDGVRLPEAVADPESGHPERLREGPRHEHVAVFQRESGAGVEAGMRGVVVVGLVEQDGGVGRLLLDEVHEVRHVGERMDGAGRVVRVAEEDEPGADRRSRHLVEVESETAGQRERLDLGAEVAGGPYRALVGAFGGDQRPVGAGVGADGGPQDLSGPGGEHHVLGLAPVHPPDLAA